MNNNETILEGHSDLEKGAYLGAIASIATADREASEEEIEYISALCDTANLSTLQKEAVLKSATELTGDELNRCLDVLKTSDLKYSLIADLITFSESDKNYSEEEKNNVEKIAEYLHINKQQFSLLDEFTQKASTVTATPEEVSKPDFLSSLGLKDKFQSAGINQSGFMKGLLGIAGPMILAKMLTGGLSRGRGRGSFGSLTPGGFGGGFGGNSRGGFGSLISMLNGGRGGLGSTGGLFSRMLNNRF